MSEPHMTRRDLRRAFATEFQRPGSPNDAQAHHALPTAPRPMMGRYISWLSACPPRQDVSAHACGKWTKRGQKTIRTNVQGTNRQFDSERIAQAKVWFCAVVGTPERIRTSDLLLRRL